MHLATAISKFKADEALEESEEQFRVLTQNLASAVALIEASGEFSIVNKSFLRLFDLDEHAEPPTSTAGIGAGGECSTRAAGCSTWTSTQCARPC